MRSCQLAACLGVVFSFRDLVVVHGQPPQETAKTLWSAIERASCCRSTRTTCCSIPRAASRCPSDLEVSFRFLHDRVRQAAYCLDAQGRARRAPHPRGPAADRGRPRLRGRWRSAPSSSCPTWRTTRSGSSRSRAAAGAGRPPPEGGAPGEGLGRVPHRLRAVPHRQRAAGPVSAGRRSTTGPSRSSWSWPSPATWRASSTRRPGASPAARAGAHPGPEGRRDRDAGDAGLAQQPAPEAIRLGLEGLRAARGGDPVHRGSGRHRRGDWERWCSGWVAARPRSCSRCRG